MFWFWGVLRGVLWALWGLPGGVLGSLGRGLTGGSIGSAGGRLRGPWASFGVPGGSLDAPQEGPWSSLAAFYGSWGVLGGPRRGLGGSLGDPSGLSLIWGSLGASWAL